MSEVEKALERLGVDFERRGRELWACCPSPQHDDKNPSWHIRDDAGNPKHGRHNCFSCGFHGDLSGLVQRLLGLDWRESLDWIAGLEVAIPKPPPQVTVDCRPLQLGFRLPAGADFAPLSFWPQAVREKLLARGVTEWQVDRWGLGYALAGTLAGRIVVPYKNARDVVVGYTGRTFVGSMKRYREPEDWEGPDRNVMFGEQHWPERAQLTPVMAARETCFVTEGAFNALAVERAALELLARYPRDHRWGGQRYPAIAATSGSNLKPLHAIKLSTFRRVLVLSDPDPAGDKVAESLWSSLVRHVRHAARVDMPAGRDSNDLAQDDLGDRISRVLFDLP